MYLLLLHPPHLHHHHQCVKFRNPCMKKQNERCSTSRGAVYNNMNMWRRSSKAENAAAARDRVIDFGKYKGKMLGSLPSGYLKWVSKNLRAGDTEEWARLADQVLVDPIYRDRIEWEFALNVLNGNANAANSSRSIGGGAASSQLEEISHRFGWDYLDKLGWAKLDFDLLGTSKAARIPRRLPNPNRLTDDHTTPEPEPEPEPISSSKRTERRERRRKTMRLREERNNNLNLNLNFNNKMEEEQQPDDDDDDDDDDHKKNKNVPITNPFPGRQALLRRAINHRTTQSQHFSPQL